MAQGDFLVSKALRDLDAVADAYLVEEDFSKGAGLDARKRYHEVEQENRQQIKVMRRNKRKASRDFYATNAGAVEASAIGAGLGAYSNSAFKRGQRSRAGLAHTAAGAGLGALIAARARHLSNRDNNA